MKRRDDILMGIVAALGMCLLIFDGKTALEGAREGVRLCLYTLIPTLLPFFFFSNVLTGVLIGRKIRILHPLGRLCRIPSGAEYMLLVGLLGGYPLGAQCISQACEAGALSRRDGRRMLAFCNNCGPAFLFGVAGALFHDPAIPWLLFSIHLISALFVAITIPGIPGQCVMEYRNKPTAVQALWNSIRAMAGVCGWVILFRVGISVLDRWVLWYLSPECRVIFHGFLELANGCIGLDNVKSYQLRFIFCAVFLSFGGLCVTMQTYSIANKVDKDIYFPGKVLQSFISLFLACLLCTPRWSVISGLSAIIMALLLRKKENRCRNPEKLVV